MKCKGGKNMAKILIFVYALIIFLSQFLVITSRSMSLFTTFLDLSYTQY